MTHSASDFTLEDGVLRFNDETTSFRATVQGQIINRQTQPSRVPDWMEKVECTVKTALAGAVWNREHLCAVTVQFCFCFGHGSPRPKDQQLDLDNYIKPVLDGLKKGLDTDDSKFRILLIRRLPDAAHSLEEEEVHLFVSSAGVPPDTEPTDQSGKDHPR